MYIIPKHLMPDPNLLPTCANLRFSPLDEMMLPTIASRTVEKRALQMRRRGTSSGVQVVPPDIYINSVVDDIILRSCRAPSHAPPLCRCPRSRRRAQEACA